MTHNQDKFPFHKIPKTTVSDLLTVAKFLISNCEKSLKRKLSDGEKRDLLKDTTSWDNQLCNRIVELLKQS